MLSTVYPSEVLAEVSRLQGDVDRQIIPDLPEMKAEVEAQVAMSGR